MEREKLGAPKLEGNVKNLARAGNRPKTERALEMQKVPHAKNDNSSANRTCALQQEVPRDMLH
jgi:hypothetical protein